MATHHQRYQEATAELAISGPWRSLLPRDKRWEVDENWRRSLILNVERWCVFDDPTRLQRVEQNPQVKQGGTLQRLKRPFVGVRDERNGLMLHHAGPTIIEDMLDVFVLGAMQFGFDDPIFFDQSLEKRFILKFLEVLESLLIDPSINGIPVALS